MKVHRIVAPQAGEPVRPDIVLEQLRVGDVKLVERDGPGIAQSLRRDRSAHGSLLND
jgi:hypothetical protein